MDKKFLLIVVALLMGLGVFAQSTDLGTPAESTRYELNARYNRPAGAFYTHTTAVNGVAEDNAVTNEFIFLKPYSDYTFHALADNIGPETQFRWQCIDDHGEVFDEIYTRDLTVNNEPCRQQTPKLRVWDGSSSSNYSWYNPSNGWAQVLCPIKMVTAVNPSQMSTQGDDIEYLLSSKSPARHSFHDEMLYYPLEVLLPYGTN